MCIRDSIYEYERVLLADIDNGTRLETYVIYGEAGSGMVCLNGAAAWNIEPGHKVIICLLYTSRCV